MNLEKKIFNFQFFIKKIHLAGDLNIKHCLLNYKMIHDLLKLNTLIST